ncbi:VOC family protein [Aquabacterium sp.]|uniref:VOC family protein n=1 Tax=Aquabacterium sp. TaxID=1872578 RepID=UPI002CE74F05|nr:VOC family protein [Aquabacterium sp.]HSW09036.1 VOC family protein [Aquabacterium sp.]
MSPPPPVIHEVFAYLRVKGAAQAIAFYAQAFGAVERFRLVEPDGRIGHVELQLGPTVLMLSEEYPEYGLLAPLGDTVLGASIHLHVDDCDACAARAVAAGATMEMTPTDQFYGERSCRVRDPFGHQWLLGHEIEKLDPDEMQRRYTALMQGTA